MLARPIPSFLAISVPPRTLIAQRKHQSGIYGAPTPFVDASGFRSLNPFSLTLLADVGLELGNRAKYTRVILCDNNARFRSIIRVSGFRIPRSL